MKIIEKNRANIFKNSENCEILEYGTESADFSVSAARISGRYPESGYAANSECREIAYILQGSGKITDGETEAEFFTGDMVVIESNEKYFWEGAFSALLVCVPAWNRKQYRFFNK